MNNAEKLYGDIIDLERPASSHPKMPDSERAAQFSPFAALTGFGDIIDETSLRDRGLEPEHETYYGDI